MIEYDMNKKTILIITDGIGHNPSSNANAFFNAHKPTYDSLFENYPNSLIKTYGSSVGLPDGQMGNSEVGHMTIGAGRVLYQDLVKINKSIQDGQLFKNKTVKKTIQNSNRVHLIGLTSDGGVHSHINHTIALAKYLKTQNKKVYIHIITDGRDVLRDSAMRYIQQIEDICDKDISIASLGGRYFSMDRDNRWQRVQKSYDTIVCGKNKTKQTIKQYIQTNYQKSIFDEFIPPVCFDNFDGIKDKDGVIFSNFRSDRMRQFVQSLVYDDFDKFETKKLDITITTMSSYDDNFKTDVIFEKDVPKDILSEIISKNGLTQLHTAETEKYAHVTFFFNGGVEKSFKNEKRVLIPSLDIKSYDEAPQMSAFKIKDVVIQGINDGTDFIVANFANGDMVGHTGNYEASIEAVQTVDKCLKEILIRAKDMNYNIVITSDHGNCEKMKDKDGNILTNHTVGDVYCFVVANKVTDIKDGKLSNIAPTVLKLMGLPIPHSMDEAIF